MGRLNLALRLLSALLATSTVAATQGECRNFPGDSCWPSQQDWQQFNETLGGKLIATVPIAAPCHESSFGGYDASACAQLKSVWSFPKTHIASSSSPMTHFFANASCDPFTAVDAQCVLGTLVQYSVKALEPADVQHAIGFAEQHNIRLVTRNTGHDYLGKSTGAGALGIWTQHMKDMEVVDYSSPYYNGKALKVGAGVQGLEAEEFAHNHGFAVMAGNGPTVGLAGGYSQGGGHGPLGSYVGLGADQVLEWEVISADGKHLIASPVENPDLYWALSGGGGGTFGVVVSMTVRTLPSPPASAANLTFTTQNVSTEAFYDVFETYLLSLPGIVDAGATSIFLLAAGSFTMQPTTAPGVSKDELQALLDPTLQKLDEHGIAYDYNIDAFQTYLDSYNAYNPPPNITEFNIGGRLMPRSLFKSSEDLAPLIDTFKYISNSGGVVSGVCVNVADGQKVANSVHSAWRSALASLVIGLPYDFYSIDDNIAAQETITEDLMPRLKQLSPHGGSYMNEADFREPDWKEAFYGNNYEWLLSIKNKYDPKGTFYAPTAVGSDAWRVTEEGRLCPA